MEQPVHPLSTLPAIATLLRGLAVVPAALLLVGACKTNEENLEEWMPGRKIDPHSILPSTEGSPEAPGGKWRLASNTTYKSGTVRTPAGSGAPVVGLVSWTSTTDNRPYRALLWSESPGGAPLGGPELAAVIRRHSPHTQSDFGIFILQPDLSAEDIDLPPVEARALLDSLGRFESPAEGSDGAFIFRDKIAPGLNQFRSGL